MLLVPLADGPLDPGEAAAGILVAGAMADLPVTGGGRLTFHPVG